MPSSLYLVNLPHNCSDNELKDWIQSHRFQVASVRIIRDVIAEVSPAFAYVRLQDDSQIEEACFVLTGKTMRHSQILVVAADEPKRIAATAVNAG
jgi:hypothetical protein